MTTSYDLTDGEEPISYAEIDYLKELVRSLPSNPVIVQIGAGTGVFTVAALEAAPDVRAFYSVDTEPCVDEFENVRRAGLDADKVTRVLGDSHELGHVWNGPRCDMLFVDGNHFGAGKDIKAWVETGRVKPLGIVAFHDYIEPPTPQNNPGNVYHAVNEGMAGYERIGRVERVIAFRAK